MEYQQHVTFLYVRDLERSLTFYHTVIGLELVLEQPGCRILRIVGTSFLGLCESERDPAGSLILTFVPADLSETYEALVSAGLTCDGPPRYNERYDIEHFFAQDPDGYRLEFQRFCSPDWPS